MCELVCEESWALKNWCFWTVVLEKTLESPLNCKEIQPVHPKGDQSWVFIGGTDAKAETPILWPPHGKSWLIGKDSDAGRDWGQEEKGTTEDEMTGWTFVGKVMSLLFKMLSRYDVIFLLFFLRWRNNDGVEWHSSLFPRNAFEQECVFFLSFFLIFKGKWKFLKTSEHPSTCLCSENWATSESLSV